ncbi:hypothetical protein A2276_01555 [candidate division WOR-1 bacterium RIFOXYA12_FULL_43_27]|uniref:Translocation and assembly module TamB C-terminal domain-containing protein n=1 Tax=candidate division WOR-1 bacterium RIFOXYC2_FULL_46_14 TaxID=1802587 RepID=A0A1F4U6R2_UNCSA|nr:MAG: hypothetical protein A2276_01555 [candidate division WOR-1 bacterium RIFOXYA12_FULL_43_27]OGC19588.1 MAG: hypothetical protein A2292_02775 [candidate division WOR-1 bacterium RIFOXYB2_FULL_46_45]OGC30577.1 MAG: hypothetical protein A2232_02775 [candidate division WOR-1 bacterium RIFOXYA2_FULL_46_56]OGC40644.1 MAG: hypothetical protein A2438_06490 [candidate division WOR-1 bacterium RIFOXYC2_FULL_46_14]
MPAKIFKATLILTACLLLSGFSLPNPTEALRENVRQQALASFRGLFHKEVKIGSAGGRILGQIVLKDVEISEDFKAKTVKINFNLVKFMQNKGDVVPAITSIEIDGGEVRAIRDKNNQINLTALFVDPNAKSNTPIDFPTKAKIYVKNSKAEYLDQPLGYKNKFEALNGTIDLRQPPILRFTANTVSQGIKIKINGESNLAKQDIKLEINSNPVNLTLNYAGNRLLISSSSDLNINAPGISGRAKSILNVSGTIQDLNGKITTVFTNASALGQQLDRGEADFSYNRGKIVLKKLDLKSKDASLSGHGTVLSDMETALFVDAKGIVLSGENFIGTTGAVIKRFAGTLSFKADHAFLSAPIRNLTASGRIEIENGKIADQIIDSASGEVSVSKGKIDFPFLVVKRKKSVLTVSGKTGINYPTDLKIAAHNLDLEDLKILNLFLPPREQNLTGRADFDLSINGLIESETELLSLSPLLDLTYSGKLAVRNGVVHGVKIVSAEADFDFTRRCLAIRNAAIDGVNSKIIGSADYRNGIWSTATSGYLDTDDFASYLNEYGNFDGTGTFQLGMDSRPNGKLSINFKNVFFNKIALGNVKAGIEIKENLLSFYDPLVIEAPASKYELSGKFDLSSQKPDLLFKISKTEINDLARLSAKIWNIVSPRAQKDLKFKKVVFPDPEDYQLYPGYLELWAKIKPETIKEEDFRIPDIKGEVQAEIKITERIDFSGKIIRPVYRDYQFDSLELEGQYQNQLLSFKKAWVTKKDGYLSAWGTLNNLRFKGRDLPVDLLGLILGKKDYKGKFNLDGTFGGEPDNPKVSLSLQGRDLSLADIKYREISAEASLENKELMIGFFDLKTETGKSHLDGTLSLKDFLFDLNVEISNEALGLINLFNDTVHYRKGKADGKMRISNNTAEGSFEVKDAVFEVLKPSSKIERVNLALSGDGNLLRLTKLQGIWFGKGTKYYPNRLSLAANINLASQTINASLFDTLITMDLENSYAGKVYCEKLKLKGSLSKPLLSGKLTFSDGILYLPEGGKSSPPPVSAAFDLNLNFLKNMYVTSGNLNSMDLTNLFINLEVQGRDLVLKGDTAAPTLAGEVQLKRGAVTVFNREFDLLSATDQEKFYPYDAEKVGQNYARFSPEYGIFPYLNITGKVVVLEDSVPTPPNSSLPAIPTTAPESTTMPLEKKEINVVAKIRGVPGATDLVRGLKIDFEAFTEDKNTSPSQMVKAPYSDKDVRFLLLPDFVRSFIGTSKENVQGSDVAADYLDSRLKVMVFRNLERRLEESLGLESLTLQYNFGKDLRRTFGSTSTATTTPQPLYGIGFIKGFYDRLYVDLKYAQFDQSIATYKNATSLNYEITYRLSPTFGLAYYQEPLTYSGVNTNYYKLTLKGAVQF